MTNDQYQQRVNQIAAETLEIRRQMSQYEFLAKKEEVERKRELDKKRKGSDLRNKYIENHLKHLSQFAGISFEQLDEIDSRLESASVSLARKNKT